MKEPQRGLAIDRAAIAELERFDGKFVVHSNDDTRTAEDMALGYKQQRVEEAWRTMKGGLRMRPVFHRAPRRIHAHIAITVLALLLERVIEHACQDTVLLNYSTAALDQDGQLQLQLRNDLYDYDPGIVEALAARRTALPR